MGALFTQFKKLLEYPVHIAVISLLLAFCGLLFHGTFFQLWTLHSDKKVLEERYEDTLKTNVDLRLKIKEAKTSDRFIGHEARDKLDLVKDDEIVFIFENDELVHN